MTQRSSPLRGATIRRLGRITRGSGIDAWPCWILWTAGDGTLETREGAAGRQACDMLAEARRRVLEARHAGEPGDEVQLLLEPGQRRREQARGWEPRCEARGQRGERGGGQRRQRRDVDRDARGVDDRARHLEPLQPFGGEPLGDDRDHAPAGGDPGPQRVHQQTGLFGRRRLGDRIDAPLGADDALRFESEDHNDRNLARLRVRLGRQRLTLRYGRGGRGRKVRRMLFLPSGHTATIEAEEGIQSNPDASSAGSM